MRLNKEAKRLNDLHKGLIKIGMDEIQGLEKTMREVIKPIEKILRDKIYWTGNLIDKVEYKSRDGFIPHSHNHGGIEIYSVIPKCEEYEFCFLEFGECEGDCGCDHDTDECGWVSEGHLDAALRIFFKFEGYHDGHYHFYLHMCGGNGDAPYFRIQNLNDLFEAEFKAKTLKDVKRVARKHINKLVKIMK